MKLFEIIFSPTGGTRKVADILADKLGYEKRIVDIIHKPDGTETADITSEDICLIAVPSFTGRVPQVAAERISSFTGNGARAILVAVYGNREYEDTLAELKDLAEAAGFECIAAVSAVAEHSIFRNIASGRPHADDIKELEMFADRINADIRNTAKNADSGVDKKILNVPGNHPYRDHGTIALKPKAGGKCSECGKCASECPVGAIPHSDPKQTITETCITCMRCVSICPAGARKNNALMSFIAGRKIGKLCKKIKKNELFLR